MPIFYFVPDREADTFKMPLTAERLLRSLGATGKLAGFRCTVYMIERIQENPEQLQLITKRLYRETGKKFGVSAASVERNLRTLIHFCWSRTDHSFLAHIAGTDLNPRLQTANFSTCLPAICEKWVAEKRGGIGLPLSMSMEVDPMRAMLIAVGHYRQEWTVF